MFGGPCLIWTNWLTHWFIDWLESPCLWIALTLLLWNVRRQALSHEVLKATGKEQSRDTKNLKQLTKTIIDRFFNSPSPPPVQVYLIITIDHTCNQREWRLYWFNLRVILTGVLLGSLIVFFRCYGTLKLSTYYWQPFSAVYDRCLSLLWGAHFRFFLERHFLEFF